MFKSQSCYTRSEQFKQLKMKLFNLKIPKFIERISIKQDVFARLSKQKCMIILFFYMILCIFFVSCIRFKILQSSYENCTHQSRDIFEMERRFSQNLKNNLELFFKNSELGLLMPATKWVHMASNVYVYSAFLEICPLELSTPIQFCVKFIGMVLSNSSFVSPFLSTLKCASKDHSAMTREELATIELLPESHDKMFTTAFLYCPLKSTNSSHASFYEDKPVNLTWVPVVNNLIPQIPRVKIFNHDSYTIKFSSGINLCVRPLYDEISYLHLTEFMAYNVKMGVDHFIFYYLKSFKNLNMFLNFLKFSNISNEVLLWDIPLDNDLIHEFGQIAFTQDCIARSKNKFGHTIIVDLDEYIVPQVHKDFKNLVSYLDDKNPFAGSYVIPMVLFCDEYFVEKSDASLFHTLSYTRRQKTPWQYWYRSKYILKPDRVRYSGIHFVWKLEKQFKEIFVPPELALLNHYRSCCGLTQTWFFHLLEFKVLNDEIVIDNTLKNHKSEIMDSHLIKFIFDILYKSVA